MSCSLHNYFCRFLPFTELHCHQKNSTSDSVPTWLVDKLPDAARKEAIGWWSFSSVWDLLCLNNTTGLFKIYVFFYWQFLVPQHGQHSRLWPWECVIQNQNWEGCLFVFHCVPASIFISMALWNMCGQDTGEEIVSVCYIWPFKKASCLDMLLRKIHK